MRHDPVGSETARKIIGEFLVRLPLVYCTPIFIGILNRNAPPISANGTATLLQIGDQKFIVTDDHVLADFEQRHAADSQCAFQTGTLPFDPLERLIDRSKEKDLCVFDAAGLDLNDRNGDDDMPAVEFYKSTVDDWPPKIVEVGDVVVLGGYPGAMRRQDGFEVTSQSFTIAAVEVTGSYPDYFTCNLDRSEWRTKHGPNDPMINFRELGGMSGGPALRDGKGIITPILSGFIMEHEPTYDQLKMSHAALITPAGKIEKGSLF